MILETNLRGSLKILEYIAARNGKSEGVTREDIGRDVFYGFADGKMLAEAIRDLFRADVINLSSATGSYWLTEAGHKLLERNAKLLEATKHD